MLSLEEAVASCERRWPGVRVDAAGLEVHLKRRQLSPADAARAEEMALAYAAGAGDAQAIAACDRDYVGRVDAALRHLRGPSTLVDDVKQALRETLFTARPGGHPKILDFAGRSDLRSFTNAVAVRCALNLLRGRRDERLGDEGLVESALPSADPRLDFLRAHDGGVVKDALRAAFAAAGDESRRLMRQYYLEGLGVEELGAVYRVAPSTITRRLAKARSQVFDFVRRELARKLRLDAREVDSLLRSMGSQLELSRLSKW